MDRLAALTQEARAPAGSTLMESPVLKAAGRRPPRAERPAGLTEREAEASRCWLADCKIGVSTRAGATLFAMRHGLVTWADAATWRRAEARRISSRLR